MSAEPLSRQKNLAARRRSDLPCVNPFCDGYGDIDITPSMSGRSRSPGACKVGPHPYPHPLSEYRTMREEDGRAAV